VISDLAESYKLQAAGFTKTVFHDSLPASNEIKFTYRDGFIVADVISMENRDLFKFSNNTVIKENHVYLSY
jgi:hypothetical protein